MMSNVATTSIASIDTVFDRLALRGHVPLLNRVSGTLEFDVADASRRWVTVRRGDVVVSKTPVNADCVFSCDADTFVGIITGKQNPVAAAIRGTVKVTGDLALALSVQRAVSNDNGR